jgi:hypothetical protein
MLFTSVKDLYEDYYITLDKERKFLNNLINLKIYEKMLNKGEVCYSYEDNGFLITYGLHDKSPRKYIKILAKDSNSVKKLLRSFLYEFGDKEFFIKVKRSNPVGRVAQSLGFVFLGGRGTEILLMRKAEKIFRNPNQRDKDEDSDKPKFY